MKYIVLFLALIMINTAFAQNHENGVAADSLQESFIIKTNTKFNYNEVEVRLDRIVVDSRCPKDVMCIRAGEAKVMVSIYKNGKNLGNKMIEIYPSKLTTDKNLIYNGPHFILYGIDLSPYPESSSVVKTKDYELTVVVKALE